MTDLVAAKAEWEAERRHWHYFQQAAADRYIGILEAGIGRCRDCVHASCEEYGGPFPWYCDCEDTPLHDSVTDPDFGCIRFSGRGSKEGPLPPPDPSLDYVVDGMGIRVSDKRAAKHWKRAGRE
jgi:hypothetical protein